MEITAREIVFQNKPFLLICGAITTKDDYINGHISYAHLKRGKVFRYGVQIGTIEDIEVRKKVPLPEQSDDAFCNILEEISDPLFFARKIAAGMASTKGKGGTIRFRRYSDIGS